MVSWLARNVLSETLSVLWQPIIRPPRDDNYSTADLGPALWTMGMRGRYEFQRKDLTLKSHRGYILQCSHWSVLKGVYKPGHEPSKKPCVIYCHTSMGSRRELYEEPMLTALLVRGIEVFALDFAGSGLSGGDYISVGYHEEMDLKIAIEHLRRLGSVSGIALWGRSMGAVAVILRLRKEHSIKAVVLDSAFTNLKLVGEEMMAAGQHIQIPQSVRSHVYSHICSEIKNRAGFDPDLINPIEDAKHLDVPVLFAACAEDSHVDQHHTQDLFKAWGTKEKQVLVLQGDHWDPRPIWFTEEAAEFMERELVLKDLLKQEAEETARQALLAQQAAEQEKLVMKAKSMAKAKARARAKEAQVQAQVLEIEQIQITGFDAKDLELVRQAWFRVSKLSLQSVAWMISATMARASEQGSRHRPWKELTVTEPQVFKAIVLLDSIMSQTHIECGSDCFQQFALCCSKFDYDGFGHAIPQVLASVMLPETAAAMRDAWERTWATLLLLMSPLTITSPIADVDPTTN